VQGVQGRDGTAVAQGAQGVQGLSGSAVAQGAQGVQGLSGSAVAQGAQGITGAQGTQGVQGVTGAQGVSTRIVNGTSEANIGASGGNANVTIGGVGNIAVFSTGGLTVAGFVSATVAVTAGTTMSAVGNISTGGNLISAGYTSAGGNILGVSLLGTAVSVTGNLTSAGIVTTGAGGAISGTGTVTAGGMSSTGNITASGNIIIGSATSGFKLAVAGPMVLSAANNEVRFNTGGPWLLGNTNILYLGTSLTATVANAKAVINNSGNLTITGVLSVNSGGNITGIVNGASNAVGNIGSATGYFNRVFAQATTALYADLAEVYEADADYSPGTVVVFGGNKEVTISTVDSSRRVAGVISENPSYLMNNGLTADHRAIVALTGRVLTLVVGNVAKGDMMVSAGNGRARAEENPLVGSIIGKSLEDFTGLEGMIEIVVGRL
jgi:hypothetical protein